MLARLSAEFLVELSVSFLALVFYWLSSGCCNLKLVLGLGLDAPFRAPAVRCSF